jgi:hypothetical protein
VIAYGITGYQDIIVQYKVRDVMNSNNSIKLNTSTFCGPGSSVGIATDYGLDDQGIESRWGRDFSHTSRPALRPTQTPVQWVPGFPQG